METMNFDRTGISKSVIQLKQIKENNYGVNNANQILKGPIRRLLRRSKSFADLKTLKSEKQGIQSKLPLPVLHEIEQRIKPALHETSQVVNKQGNKRPLPIKSKPQTITKRVKSDETTKGTSKVVPTKPGPSKPPVKSRNPPSYDYKARFNILQEKHHTLRDAHAKLKEESATNKTEHEAAQQNLNILRKELERLKTVETDLVEVRNENMFLKSNNENLTKNLDKANEAQAMLTGKYDSLAENYHIHEIKLIQVTEELEMQTKNLESTLHDLDNYKTALETSEDKRRMLHNTIQDMKGNIRVFCRIRPPLSTELDESLSNINYVDECTLELIKNKDNTKSEFSFNKIFPPPASQIDVFEDLSQLVQSALDGYNVCVFAYGQTGSGKTYTMQGAEVDSDPDGHKLSCNEVPNSAGMIPRSMHLLFDKIENLKSRGWNFTLEASFLEIYNETLRDLLDQTGTKQLDIRYNEGKGVTVTNLKTEPIESFEDFKRHMLIAQKYRAVAVTNYNEHSSRSHAVTKIHIHGINKNFKITYTCSINFIDLAGSESAKTSKGERLMETKSINKSLSALGNVMLALQNRENHVPYRNSKLTYLLQSCLGGNSKTLMFVNLSPFEKCFNETTSSLRFASTVKDVKLNLRKNKGYT